MCNKPPSHLQVLDMWRREHSEDTQRARAAMVASASRRRQRETTLVNYGANCRLKSYRHQLGEHVTFRPFTSTESRAATRSSCAPSPSGPCPQVMLPSPLTQPPQSREVTAVRRGASHLRWRPACSASGTGCGSGSGGMTSSRSARQRSSTCWGALTGFGNGRALSSA